jgi:quinol monooxygenase YgiN
MTRLGQPYTSGDWLVKEGNEQAFVDLWEKVADFCVQNYPGARGFRLIRDAANPRHFISFGEWNDFDSVSVSRSRPQFLRLFRGCQGLCDEFSGSDYTVSLFVPGNDVQGSA